MKPLKISSYVIITILIFISNFKYMKGLKCNSCYGDGNGKCIPSGSTGSCPLDCRPHFYSGPCYDCSDAFRTNPYKLYSIEGGNCILPTEDHIYIISETNEFVRQTDYQSEISDENQICKFGDFIYKTCPSYCSSNNHECKCNSNNKIYKDTLFGKNLYRCVESCPYAYYEYDADNDYFICANIETVNALNVANNNYYIRTNNSIGYNCDQSFYYKDGNKKYCLENCPSSKPFFYSGDNIPLECIAQCNDLDFYDFDLKECTQFCYGQSWIDIQNGIFICKSSATTCPENFPYKYENNNICLRNCADTEKPYFSNSFTDHYHFSDNLEYKTYSLIPQSGPKKCVRQCNDNDKKYIDVATSTCVSDCSKTSRKYYYPNDQDKNKCLETCDDNDYHDFDSYECRNSGCTNTYFKYKYKSNDVYTCYDNCNRLSPFFYFDSQRQECLLSCPDFIFKGENNNLYCLSSCQSSYKPSDNSNEVESLSKYHRYGDNICIEDCDANSDISEYYYIRDVTNKVCYQSCDDINKKNNNNYFIYEYNSQCFNSNSGFQTKTYYKMKSGIIKYKSPGTTETDVDFCSKAGFYYFKSYTDGVKECTNCEDTNDYKIPYLFDESGKIQTLGECLDLDKCKAKGLYYNKDNKICNTGCSHKILYNVERPNSLTLGSSDEGNCLIECPSSYKYESSNGNYCYNKCPSTEYYYYEIRTNKYKCIQNCITISKFYNADNDGKCLDICDSAHPYYIPGNINNECLTTCMNNDVYKFSLQSVNGELQPCLKECPLRFQYYKNDDKICLSSCTNYFKSETKECVTNCDSGEFIINENECSDGCKGDAIFLEGGYTNPKKCVIKCDSHYALYYKHDTLSTDDKVIYQCTNDCSESSNYKLKYGNRCVNECPEGTFKENNECKIKCQVDNSYFIRKPLSDGKLYYECTTTCDNYIDSSNECIENCPREENFMYEDNGKNFCKNHCDNFYEKFDIKEDKFGHYIIYKCKTRCDGEKINVIDGTKECVKDCPEAKPYLLGTTCVSICLKDQIKPFSAMINGNKICSEKCSIEGTTYKYYGDDKICIESCNIFENKKYHNEKANDYACISHCDLKSENKFTYIDDHNNDNNDKYYCLDSCDSLSKTNTALTPKLYYSTDDYVCDVKCNERNIYLIPSQHICSSKCPDNLVANPSSGTDMAISPYRCEYTCSEGKYYYENERICGKCKPNHYIIQGTQKCIEFCDQINSQKKYYFYEKNEESKIITSNTCVTECPEDRQFKDYNNHCSKSCSESYKFYRPSEKRCMDKCPEGTLTNGNLCVEKCPEDKVEDQIAKVCLDDCSQAQRNYIFYSKTEKVCKKECNPGEFVYRDGDKYKCMSSCDNINEGLNKLLYIDGNNCVETCPDTKKFFVSQTEYGEKNISKYCLTDCPIGYEFYKYNRNECSGICHGYYITNKDPHVIGKECRNKCNNDYPFILIHNSTHKECVELCPKEQMFYVEEEETGKKTCYEKCPPSSPFHDQGDFKCKTSCTSQIANKNNMECVTDCELNQFWAYETQNNVKTKICYDNCNQTNYAQFYTFKKECVRECDQTNSFLKGNLETGACECRGLYYVNSDGLKECIDPAKKLCTETETDYKIQVNNTNQCTKICFGVLSVDGDVCYWGPADTIKCPENSVLSIIKGVIICECQYGFYMNLQKKKVCLDKTLKCPDYKYFNTETRECVQDCGSLLLLDGKCYKYCPMGMIEQENTCVCAYNFYKIDDNNYVCLEKDDPCPYEYQYLVEEKKECVKECSKEYPISYDMKCRSDCEENYYKIKDPSNPDKFICMCKYSWYYGKSEESICIEENKNKSCKELGFEYTVVKTNQCVSSCKGEYQYYFNKNCYYSCSEANLVQDEKSSKCKCKEKWRIKDNEIECIQNCDKSEILITETNQCIPSTSKCSFEKPLLWNNLCYDKCPQNTIEDSVKGNSCKCEFNWFKKNDGLIECMGEGVVCPYDSHPYLIHQTKECVKDETFCKDKYIFDFTCYDECPTNTIKSSDEDNNNCECNTNAGFWAKAKDKYGRDILNCGLHSCENLPEKNKYDNETKECVSSCDEISKNLYLDVCYKECPPLTTKVNNENKCKLSTEFDNPDLEVLLKNVGEKIVEINKYIPSGGIVVNNEENEATMQIYRLEKNENKNKEAILRSNMAYIDISECIEKIYKNNKMNEDEKVIVVKLDLKPNNKKLIVSPVEYEFRNSKTGALLDASVCGRNEVVISYPMTYILKNRKFLRHLDDEELIEIGEKFRRGKILYEKDYSIDSFNYNSTIYSNICYPIEVEGKDLTLENRISYFYPNYSFCESSCAYDYTDFEGERIYCNCSIKLKIDIDRPQGAKLSEYNKEETDNNQMGPSNLPILRCLSKVKIGGNPAFYVCLIFLLVHICLLFIVIFKGIASVINSINRKMYKDETINDSNVEEDYKMTVKNNENNNGKTSERKLNNPPKKNNYMDEKIKDKNIKGKKNQKKIEEKNKFDIYTESNKSEEYYNYLKKNEIDADKGFFTSMKKEQKYLRENFSVSMTKDKFDFVVVVLTSIFDKIYLSKILVFSNKYQITSLMFSLYLLCHLLLLTFCALFFDIKTIGKIFENEDYPSMGYYILYGFLGNLIVWVIFKLFYCLIDNSNNIRKLLKKNENTFNNQKKMLRLEKLISGIKRDTIIYLVFQFVLIFLCSLYLIAFCGIYTGTKTKLFLSYAFAVVTIVIIKIVYGLILGILRKISLFAEKNYLYNVVLIFNKYLS